MATTDIKQEIFFPVSPLELYDAIMDETSHSSFTDSDVTIKDEVGTKFTTYNGYIEGINVILERGRKIVQTWKADEIDWDENHFSTVIMEFKEENGGTMLKFSQMDVPMSHKDSISQGWYDYYWEPLKLYFEEKLKPEIVD